MRTMNYQEASALNWLAQIGPSNLSKFKTQIDEMLLVLPEDIRPLGEYLVLRKNLIGELQQFGESLWRAYHREPRRA